MPLIVAGPAYASAMAAIHAKAFSPAMAWRERDIATQLTLPGVYGLLHPDGGMLLTRLVLDEAEILTLAVAPSAQRSGIGTALVRGAAEMARVRGAPEMFLEVSVINHAARALYAGLGFTSIGLRARYYDDGSDAIMLRRCLD